jgi:hypothetical protein
MALVEPRSAKVTMPRTNVGAPNWVATMCYNISGSAKKNSAQLICGAVIPV